MNGYESWLERLALFIRYHRHNITREVAIKTDPYGRPHSVNFIYHPEDEDNIEIDLYVSPYWDTCKEFYKFLMRVPRRRRALYVLIAKPMQHCYYHSCNRFYGCAAKWQKIFIQRMVTHGEYQVYISIIMSTSPIIWCKGKHAYFLSSLL